MYVYILLLIANILAIIHGACEQNTGKVVMGVFGAVLMLICLKDEY